MAECTIRRMTLADLDAVADLEKAIFPHPWSRLDFEQELTRNVAARYLVAEVEGTVVGYAGAWVILDESHITNIALDEAWRGKHIGRKLTEGLMQYISNLGAAYATLEVRKSNIVAQKLYASVGFVSVGVRKRYYEDNREDALLMVCEHMPPADPDFEEEETIHE